MNQYFATAMKDIQEERQYQQNRWGDDFDKLNTPNDWIAYIVSYTGKAVTMPWNWTSFRTQLVKVACLCCAAIEWCDRVDGNMPKRHYDE